MVANWKLFPVGHESVVFAPEHGSHIGRMRDGGIEICVVSDMAWQMHLKSQHKLNLDTGNSISLSSLTHLNRIHLDHTRLLELGVISESWVLHRQKLFYRCSRLSPMMIAM